MAEKLNQDNLQIINFRMTPEEIARLDRMATKMELSRSQFLRNLILTGLDEAEMMEKLGIVRASLTVRDILDWIADRAKRASEDIDKDKPDKA